MTIKTRLSFQFTLLVAGILLFFCLLIYYFSYSYQLSRFREILRIQAENTAILLINVEEVDSVLLKKIHSSTITLEEEEIVIVDSASKTIWSNNRNLLTDNVVRQYQQNESSYLKIQHKDGIHYKHNFRNATYSVFIMACDRNRASNLSDLREIFFWSIIISLLVSVLLSYFFSRMAIEPISRIISGIKATNSSQLSKRLEAGNSNDEIGQLVLSFNEMLHNLEKAFKNQQEFISNASHEMRTPLAVMIAESDYIVSRPRTPSEYENHIKEVIRDLKGLNSLLYNLLELAQLNQVTPMKLTEVRIDEVLYQSVHQVKKLHQGRKIVVKALYSDNEHDLLVNGNPGLLEIAFRNLLENACKFSTEEVIVEITMKAERIHIQILDKGIGIPSREIEKIFDPFSRATNVRLKAGFGIGLSIVHTIIKLHSGEINVTSSENIGTRFELIFNKIS